MSSTLKILMLQTAFKSPYLKFCGLKSKGLMYFIFLTYQNLKPTTYRKKKNQMKKFNFQLASSLFGVFQYFRAKAELYIPLISSACCTRIPKSANIESRF